MKHRHHTQMKKGGKRADGGGIRNAELAEAHDTHGGFKRGGMKKKHGGMAEGKKGHHRLDRKGRMHKASGGSALSTASKTSERSDSEPGSGKESVKVGKGEPSEDEPDGASRLACGGAAKSGGKLTAEARKHISAKNFALPGRRYPIEDASHARNALARVSQHGSPEEKAKVRAAVHRKYPGIGRD